MEAIKKEGNLSLRTVGLLPLKSFLKRINKDITLFIDDTVNFNSLKKSLYRYQNKEGSKLFLQIKINKKIINLNIPGKFDYLSLLNNEIKGVRILN